MGWVHDLAIKKAPVVEKNVTFQTHGVFFPYKKRESNAHSLGMKLRL